MGGGYGAIQGVQGLADGEWNYSDIFNLLSLVPFALPAITSVRRSIRTFRSVNQAADATGDVARAADSADATLQASRRTEVEVSGTTSPQVANSYDNDVEVTPIHRVVQDEELADIQSTGIFRPSPYGSEGKYFSSTPEGAASYAQQAYNRYNDPPYTLVESSIPSEFLTPDMRVNVDRGIDTYVIPNDLLPYLNPPVIRDSIPIPRRR